MLIASTSCVTIIFSAILSPLVLGENFFWRTDGISITFIAMGSLLAVTQQTSESIPNPISASENLTA
jgi:hypothetical protein